VIKHQFVTSLDNGRLASAATVRLSTAHGHCGSPDDDRNERRRDGVIGDVTRQREPAPALT